MRRPDRIEPDRAIPENPSDDWIRHAEALKDNEEYEWRMAGAQNHSTRNRRMKTLTIKNAREGQCIARIESPNETYILRMESPHVRFAVNDRNKHDPERLFLGDADHGKWLIVSDAAQPPSEEPKPYTQVANLRSMAANGHQLPDFVRATAAWALNEIKCVNIEADESHECLDAMKASNAEMRMALESVLEWYGEHSEFDTEVCIVASRIAVANARKRTGEQT